MAEKDKAAQRMTVVYQFGMLMTPLEEMAKKTPPPTASEFYLASAKGQEDIRQWTLEVADFATVGGHRLGLAGEITRELDLLLMYMPGWARNNPHNDAGRQQHLLKEIERCRKVTLNAIDRVPIDWPASLSEAKSPFSVYLKIRDAIGTAKRRLHYLDRYLDSTFYELYLRDIDRALEVRLVTTKGKAGFGVANVLPVSRVAAREFTNYQLIECLPADLHERDLRIDDTVFFLGNSIKDAGEQPTTFSPGDSSPSGHGILDRLIARGIEAT